MAIYNVLSLDGQNTITIETYDINWNDIDQLTKIKNFLKDNPQVRQLINERITGDKELKMIKKIAQKYLKKTLKAYDNIIQLIEANNVSPVAKMYRTSSGRLSQRIFWEKQQITQNEALKELVLKQLTEIAILGDQIAVKLKQLRGLKTKIAYSIPQYINGRQALDFKNIDIYQLKYQNLLKFESLNAKLSKTQNQIKNLKNKKRILKKEKISNFVDNIDQAATEMSRRINAFKEGTYNFVYWQMGRKKGLRKELIENWIKWNPKTGETNSGTSNFSPNIKDSFLIQAYHRCILLRQFGDQFYGKINVTDPISVRYQQNAQAFMNALSVNDSVSGLLTNDSDIWASKSIGADPAGLRNGLDVAYEILQWNQNILVNEQLQIYAEYFQQKAGVMDSALQEAVESGVKAALDQTISKNI